MVSPGIAIIKRELLSGLRSARPYLFLTLLMLIMIGGLLFMLESAMVMYQRYGMSMGGESIRSIYMAFSLCLYFSAVLIVPPMAGVSICTEKQRDSYDLLLMTYIRPHSLALAKLVNVLGIYVLIVIATLPIAGVFFFLVGIDWQQFIYSAIVIAVSTLSCAAFGLLCSAWFYRTLPAVITAFLGTILLHGGFFFVLMLFGQLVLGPSFFSSFFRNIDELLVAVPIPVASLAFIGSGYYSALSLVLTVIYHAVIVTICTIGTLSILRKPPRPMRVEQERPIDDQEVLKARRRKFPYYLLDPRRRRPMIPDERNPLLSKELQTGLIGRGSFAVRIFYSATVCCFLVSVLSIVASDFRVRDPGHYIAWPALIDTMFILILMPALIATTMAKEHEWGNMDMLLMTLIEPGQIVTGKFRTALYTACLPMGGALLGLAPLFFNIPHWPSALAGLASGLGSMAVCVVFTLALSLLVSIRARQSITGLVMAYGASIAMLIVFPYTVLFLWMLISRSTHIDQEAGDPAAFVSPLFAQIINLKESRGGTLLSLYWFSNTAVFLLISAALVRRARRRFVRDVQRGFG